MSALVMNQNGAIDHSTGSPISGGVFVITGSPDAKVKAESFGVYVSPLAFTFSGGDAAGFVSGTVSGGGTIIATATKTRVSGVFVMREGDSGILSATGTLSGGGTGSVSGGVEITDAGQSSWRSE